MGQEQVQNYYKRKPTHQEQPNPVQQSKHIARNNPKISQSLDNRRAQEIQLTKDNLKSLAHQDKAVRQKQNAQMVYQNMNPHKEINMERGVMEKGARDAYGSTLNTKG
jgi:hypothetical protein